MKKMINGVIRVKVDACSYYEEYSALICLMQKFENIIGNTILYNLSSNKNIKKFRSIFRIFEEFPEILSQNNIDINYHFNEAMIESMSPFIELKGNRCYDISTLLKRFKCFTGDIKLIDIIDNLRHGYINGEVVVDKSRYINNIYDELITFVLDEISVDEFAKNTSISRNAAYHMFEKLSIDSIMTNLPRISAQEFSSLNESNLKQKIFSNKFFKIFMYHTAEINDNLEKCIFESDYYIDIHFSMPTEEFVGVFDPDNIKNTLLILFENIFYYKNKNISDFLAFYIVSLDIEK